MKEIILTRGKVAMVDDDDFNRLNKYKWHSTTTKGSFYAARVNRGKVTIYMHRCVIGDIAEGMECDHIDGNGLNNQRSNLRAVTHRQNLQNQHRSKASRFPGIYFEKKKWVARPRINGEKKYLGRFPTEEAAFDAYKKEVGLCIPLQEIS